MRDLLGRAVVQCISRYKVLYRAWLIELISQLILAILSRLCKGAVTRKDYSFQVFIFYIF